MLFTSTGMAAGRSLMKKENNTKLIKLSLSSKTPPKSSLPSYSPNVLPVDALEEGVLLDLLQAAVGADALQLLSAEVQHQITRLAGDGNLRRKDQRLAPVHHLPVGFLGGLAAEGRVADEHLVHDHPQRPPVGTVRRKKKRVVKEFRSLFSASSFFPYLAP